MNVKIDFPGSIQRAINVTTQFAKFWTDKTLPTDFGPSLSHLIVIGLLPLIGSLLGGLITFLRLSNIVGGSYFFQFVIITPILQYAFFVGMPLLLGVILGALDPGLNINKGKAPEYAYVLAMAASPAAIGGLLSGIITPLPLLGWLGWLIGLVFWGISIIVTYLAFTEGLKVESGQAIILMVIMVVIYIVLYAIIFMAIIGSMFGAMGAWGNPYMYS
jgi:hypothetical protein